MIENGEPVKILNVIDIPWFSGIASYALESARGLSERGHKIYFAGLKDRLPLKNAGNMGFKTVFVCSRKNPFILKSILELKKIIETEKIDIVNAFTGSAHFMVYLTSLITVSKFSVIRTKADILQPKKSFLYKRTEKIIAGSNLIREQYLKIGVEPSKLATVYQGMEMPCDYHGGMPDVPTVGMIGRLDPVKGHKYFIKAAALVLKKYPAVKFMIAGKEENIKYSELKQIAAREGIVNSIEFCGYVKNVRDFMERCSMGVISSTGSEAISRVLLEWMNCGKAVVSTRVGCIPEILPAEFTVPPENSELMADKILSLLNDIGAVEIFGRKNRDNAGRNFNFKKFVDETEKIYYEAINRIAH